MKEFKIYSVSDRYISFLQERFPNVYSNKEQHRTHTRKYVGIVIEINGFAYYIPFSSPKNTDYQTAGDRKVIKKSIIPLYRIVVKNSKGDKELKGTLLRLAIIIRTLFLWDVNRFEKQINIFNSSVSLYPRYTKPTLE